MIRGYFGVPGCGKTSLASKIAITELLKNHYDEILTINFQCSGCIPVTYDVLKDYKFKKTLVMIDEITMNADNRKFKTFSDAERDFFILHRHLKCDIIYFTQNFENVDKKVRDLTQDLWYIRKSVVPLLSLFSRAVRIYREIKINEYTGELKLGYRFCQGLEKIFAKNIQICFRPRWYKFFDSYDELSLKNRPVLIVNEKERIPMPSTKLERKVKKWRKKTIQYLNSLS